MVVGSLGVLATVSKGEGARRNPLMRRCVEQAWKLRFVAIMSCAAAWAVASSLVELRCMRISRRFALHGGSLISFTRWDL